MVVSILSIIISGYNGFNDLNLKSLVQHRNGRLRAVRTTI